MRGAVRWGWVAVVLASSAARGAPQEGAAAPVVTPTAPRSFFTVQGESFSVYPDLPPQGPSGLLVAWGSFQNRYFAATTRLGLSRADPSLGTVLVLGGGGQFHVPLGERWRVVPGFTFGYRLAQGGAGMSVSAELAALYVMGRFYAGVGAETFLFSQGGYGSATLPGNVSGLAQTGFYY